MDRTSATAPQKSGGNEDERLLDVEAGLDAPLRPRSSRRTWLLPGLGALLLGAYIYSQFARAAATASASGKPPRPLEPFDVILAKAGRRALGGGLSGAAAGVAQVLLLMWLRTTMNYQYRHGTGAAETFRLLYAEGGVRRFYQGLPWALLQTPLTRFGDTAANSGVLLLLGSTAFGQAMPLGLRTAVASATAALWRVLLTPVDTLKTTMQVQGAAGYALVMAKVGRSGPGVLWSGAAANFAANFVGNYPWYMTFNQLEGLWAAPLPEAGLLPKLLRHALLGLCATCVSDCTSNSIRVIKTTRQTAEVSISYTEAVQAVVRQDGWAGLFGRGLGVRLATNGIQASLFTILWKMGEEHLARRGLA